MGRIKIFINGYGNIGRRLATAISSDKDLELVGIAKYSLDNRINEALEKGYNIYVPETLLQQFKDNKYPVAGTILDAINACDLVIDAAKEGIGYTNRKNYYEPNRKPAIFQGGEERYGEQAVADMIHNSRVNYDKAFNKKYVIQGSCNVSGMGRIMKPLLERYGDDIHRFDVTLIRRWADLEDSKSVKDSIEWDKSPHHQNDVKDFLPEVNLFVEAYKVPSRMMHLHQMFIRFKKDAPSKDNITEVFRKEFGISVIESAKGTADVRKKAIELGFAHGDTNMVHIHNEMTRVQGDIVKIAYSDDQTGMVIPENHMLLQSMMMQKPRNESLSITDKLFNINKKKQILEEEFR